MHKTLNNKHENLVIITAPSGAGKTTLIKNILDHANSQDHKVFLSISHTTRQPRHNEKFNEDYFKPSYNSVLKQKRKTQTSSNIKLNKINLFGFKY